MMNDYGCGGVHGEGAGRLPATLYKASSLKVITSLPPFSSIFSIPPGLVVVCTVTPDGRVFAIILAKFCGFAAPPFPFKHDSSATIACTNANRAWIAAPRQRCHRLYTDMCRFRGVAHKCKRGIASLRLPARQLFAILADDRGELCLCGLIEV